MKRALSMMLILGTFGCAAESVDPRCASLCTIVEPDEYSSLVCSRASADACIDLCERRIADTNSLCGDCLLEGATFETGERPRPRICPNSDACGGGAECTESGAGQTCSYCLGDTAQAEECRRLTREVHEIDCMTTFQATSECTGFCG